MIESRRHGKRHLIRTKTAIRQSNAPRVSRLRLDGNSILSGFHGTVCKCKKLSAAVRVDHLIDNVLGKVARILQHISVDGKEGSVCSNGEYLVNCFAHGYPWFPSMVSFDKIAFRR